MLSLWDTLGLPSSRVPISLTTFASYILPPIVCYFTIATLAVKPKTRTARVALWPITSLLALRAVVSIDMTINNSWQKAINTSLVYYMFCIVVRTFDWTLEKEPLVRHLRPANDTLSIFMDVFDLLVNLRGVGWDWSHRTHIPRETRSMDRNAFVFSTFLSAVQHALIFGVLHRAILSFIGVGSITQEPTIYDDSLPLLPRYLRASIISFFTGFIAYASMQMGYDMYTIPAVLFLGQDPAQWPPLFDAPWRATSLTEFWGRRWHQWNRRALLSFGGHPFSLLLGRTGLILGTFLASGIMHDMVLLSIDGRIEFWRMMVGFGMMGPGILAERAFYRLTGKRVGGAVGWVWMMTWLIVSGCVMAEGLARGGVFMDYTLIDEMLPLKVLVEHSAINLDAWLHTI